MEPDAAGTRDATCGYSRAMEIYFVRHGETVWNRDLRLQGRADSPLTLRGVRLALAYAERLRELLAGVDDVAVYTSPLGRATQTAAIVADAIGVQAQNAIRDSLLAEQDVGAFEGRSWAQIEQEHGLTTDRYRAWDFRVPDGESRVEMFERARRWLAQPRGCQVAVVVSHGGFSRVFRGAYLALEPPAIMTLPPHDHGRMFRLADGRSEELAVPVGPAVDEAALG